MGPVTNPRPLSSLLDREQRRIVTPIVGQSVLLVPADVDRSYFVVINIVSGLGQLVISPDPDITYGIVPVGAENYIRISSDDWPLLCQQEWYALAPNPGPSPLLVIEVRRSSGA